MRRPPFTPNDAPRKLQAGADGPLGYLRSIPGQVRLLAQQIAGLELRTTKRLEKGEPGSIGASMTWHPESDSAAFDFDYLQNGVSSVSSQYVLRDNQTYVIPITFPPPGIFVARFLKVRLYQRLYVPGCGPMQVPMNAGDFAMRANQTTQGFQTMKFAFPVNSNETTRHYMRRLAFFWNLVDSKSNLRFSDQLVSDQALLPQGFGVPSSVVTNTGSNRGLPAGNTGGMLRFKTPWPFEHDGQAAFLFRPITPVIQPLASAAYTPYPFEDRENNNRVRDSSVTIRIELHGTRYYTARDAMGKGALVPGGAA